MRKVEISIWNNFLLIHVLCFLVISVVSIHDDFENESAVSTENTSHLIENDVKIDLNDNLPVNDSETNDGFSYDVLHKKDEGLMGQTNFVDRVSQNTGALNDITTGGESIVLPLPETATSELEEDLVKLSASLHSTQLNEPENNTKEATPSTSRSAPINEIVPDLDEPKNITDTAQSETNTTAEEIPSFSEWTQKRLEEAEKNEELLNQSMQNTGASVKPPRSGVKLGWKNYASPECGAKVLAANPEAISPSSVISPSREEYKLNVCSNRIWFIIELCEAIQAKKIDIANFELFSSTPKDFTVSIGDRFPNREWTTVGQFTAKDERDIQRFDLSPFLFGRYIKVEITSHHGSQHYCPISLVRVYGTSELEVLQKEESAHLDDDDDVDDDELTAYSDDITKNMLDSATNAVYSMIKKAAEVLGSRSNDTEKENNISEKLNYTPLINTCSTPSHKIICQNCSDVLFGQVYELLSCKSLQIYQLVALRYIRNSLVNSDICMDFGLHLQEFSNRSTFNRSSHSVRSFFSSKILGAMCNMVSIIEFKAVLNSSLQYSNVTKKFNASLENLTNIEISKPDLKINIPITDSNSEKMPTPELKLDSTNNIDVPKATCSTDISYSIKPTKTVLINISDKASNIFFNSETEGAIGQVIKTEIPSEVTTGKEDENVAGSEILNTTNSVDANVEATTESSENIDQIENFIRNINNENEATTVPSVSSNSNQVDRQKESVFLRLSNRIKALEKNVSLSSQYLEELSRRYKKQVEEMQKMMESVTDELHKMDERNKQLEEHLDSVKAMMGKWPSFFFWFFFTLATTCAILWLCGTEKQRNRNPSIEKSERRKSVDIISVNGKKPKTRRPSDQALKIVRSSLLHEERKLSKEKHKRRKSNKSIKRSNSLIALESDDSRIYDDSNLSQRLTNTGRIQNLVHVESSSQNGDWIEENRRLSEVISLDESEHSYLEPFSVVTEQNVPKYAKTAADARSQRMSGQFSKAYLNSGNRYSHDLPRKSESLDESYRFNDNKRLSLNTRINDTGQKKEKRSFKSVLKNVFT